ncbi:MAG: P-loop NTPase fold protein [Anaerolineae bacterium]
MPEPPTHSPLVDDLPSPDDKLGFEPYALALSDILLDPNTRTPLTLGLFGSWGSGKTSLMLQMQKALKEDKSRRYRTVWFNAWKYNREDALWRALLLVLLDDLERLLEKEPPAKPKKGEANDEPAAKVLLDLLREALYHETSWSEQGERSINWSQALTVGAGIGLNLALSFLGPGLAAVGMAADTLQEARKELGKGAPVSKVGELAKAFRREEIVHYQAQLRSLEQFQENFARLVKMLLQPEGKTPRRLVVFVDDLDRCLPEKAIEVLEALKLFLDVEGCIYVLALDNEAIESTIRRRYQGEVKARRVSGKDRPGALSPAAHRGGVHARLRAVAGAGPARPALRRGLRRRSGRQPAPGQAYPQHLSAALAAGRTAG